MTDDKPRFCGIHELLVDRFSVPEVATAVEEVGFYTWDPYGRFLRVSLKDLNPYKEFTLNALKEALQQWRQEAIEARINDGHDEGDLIYSDDCVLHHCGWPSNDLPDFREVYQRWHLREIGHGDITDMAEPAPGKQSKVWGLVRVLLIKAYGDKVVKDLGEAYSQHAQSICNDLKKNHQFALTAKSLKNFVRNAD